MNTCAGRSARYASEVELGGREVHQLAVAAHPPGRRVDRDRRRRDGVSAPPVGARPALDPPQQRVDAGDELARAERLGQVVVGADAEADDEVGLGVAGGEHQHRDRPVALDRSAHLEAVEAGEHEVEDHEVGVELARQRLDARRAVGGDLDA